jgi:hypothetical protein
VTQPRGRAQAIVAAIFLMIQGVLNVIYGIAGISKSHVFIQNAHYIFGNLRTEGWIALIIGIVEIIAAVSVWQGAIFGRVIGIAAASLAAIDALIELPSYPLLAIANFALSIWIIHGLAVYQEAQPRATVNQGPARR